MVYSQNGHFDTAQICPNGHVATATASVLVLLKPFCDRCGEATIMQCPTCGGLIQGAFEDLFGSTSLDNSKYTAPAFCFKCGAPFPWTVSRRKAAIELFNEVVEDEQQRQQFASDVEQLSKDTPEAQVASRRINSVLKEISKGVSTAIRGMIVEIGSETAKKMITPGP